jgi:MATE family, multidrug efflux pump
VTKQTAKPTTLAAEGRALFVIAWPMFIAQLAQMGTGVVDTVMAGHYSATDLAAIAIGYNIWLPIYIFFVGLMLGATAIVAQDFGAGRLQRIRDSLPQSLWLALVAGLVAGPLCFFADPLLDLLDLDPATHDKSIAYLRAVAFGMPAASIFQALRCHTQGIGVMRPFAIASVIGFFANIPLNYAFIYGHFGAPEMGAAGCGLATAISMWLAPVLIAFYMKRASNLKPYLPPLKLVRPRREPLIEIARLGLPMGLTFFLEIAVFSVIALMIATLGNTAMAAHQIAFNVWDVVYMPLISIGSAMATRIGHAVGAGDRAAMRLSLRCGLQVTAVVAVLCMAILMLAPEPIIRAYTTDQEIRHIAITLIRLAAIFILFDALQVTTSFSLRAFKEARYPFLVMCIAYWGLTLPLGYWLGIVNADDALAGTVGFWQAMIVGILVATVLICCRLWIVQRRPLPVTEQALGAEA